jgi:apolipoprotein D and lipocalin family protein
MYAPTLILSFLLAVGASPLADTGAILHERADTGIVDATWDGRCTYPKPDANFNLTDYLGTWYQVAATRAFFNIGCTCVTAVYTPNDDGTVKVVNTCRRFGQTSKITGSAAPVDKAYGAAGVFDVQLNGAPPIKLCPGPNYIVQVFEGDWAIVQAGDFSTLFILSRKQVVDDADIDTWLKRAESLGSNLALVAKTKQTDCPAP